MDKEQLEKWSRENGKALPFLKSNKKWGLRGSSAIDKSTFEESYEALKNMYPNNNYPNFSAKNKLK